MPFDQRSLIHLEVWFPGGPTIPENPIFLENGKNPPKRKNSKTSRDMPKFAIRPFDQRSLIHQEAWFLPCFVKQNQQKNKLFFCKAILDHFRTKMFKSETTFFHYFSPRIPNLCKILDIGFREMGPKRCLNGTSKVNRQTDGQTDRHTDRQIDGYFDF